MTRQSKPRGTENGSPLRATRLRIFLRLFQNVGVALLITSLTSFIFASVNALSETALGGLLNTITRQSTIILISGIVGILLLVSCQLLLAYMDRFQRQVSMHETAALHPIPQATDASDTDREELLRELRGILSDSPDSNRVVLGLPGAGKSHILRGILLEHMLKEGLAALGQGNLAEARDILLRMLGAAREFGDREKEATALSVLGTVEAQQADVAAARHYHEEALSIFADLNMRPALAGELRNLGELAEERGQLEEALDYYRQSLSYLAPDDDLSGLALALSRLGDIALRRGEFNRAMATYYELLAISKQTGNRRAVGISLTHMGEIAQAQGDLAQAAALYQQALSIDREIGDRQGESVDLVRLGDVSQTQEHLEQAEAYFQQAIAIEREVGNIRGEAGLLGYLGELAWRQSRIEEAQGLFEQALALHREIGDRAAEEEDLARLDNLGRGASQSEEEFAKVEEELAEVDEEGGEDTGKRSRVHFSAFYPRIVPVKTKRMLVVYVHIPEVQPRVRAEAMMFRPLMGNVEPTEVTTTATRPVSRGTYLTIVPDCDGIEFNPPSMRLKWGGREERAVFSFEADVRLAGSGVNGEIDIYVEMLNVATLKLAFLCDENGTDSADDQQESTAPLYERIFASYSHSDTAIVEACRRAYVALGMKVLIDTEDLRSGELFTPALMRMINDANVFQLFWSDRSARSDFVRKEWTHALGLNRGAGFIRPVRWERPLTPAPAELTGLGIHFKFIPLPSVDENDAPPTRSGQQAEQDNSSTPHAKEAPLATISSAATHVADFAGHTNDAVGQGSSDSVPRQDNQPLRSKASQRRRWWLGGQKQHTRY